jgi:hypothetical protein
MYAKLILRFQCYNVVLGMLCHLWIFVRSFYLVKPGREAKGQISIWKNEYLYVNILKGMICSRNYINNTYF